MGTVPPKRRPPPCAVHTLNNPGSGIGPYHLGAGCVSALPVTVLLLPVAICSPAQPAVTCPFPDQL